VTYTIAATRQKVGEHESAGVRGTICVTNTGEVATEGLAITDVVEYKKPPAVTDFTPFLTVTVDVSEKPVLGPGESHCYDYEIPFTPLEGVAQYRNHAIVTITNHSGHLGEPFGPEPKAGFSLPDSPTVVEVDESASVSDEEHCPAGFTCAPSETGPWTFHDSGSVSFHKTITNVSVCDATAELHNVATLTEGDTHETRTAEAVVHLTAPPCPVGCVLTQGFWKTHPDAWPAGHSPNDPFFTQREDLAGGPLDSASRGRVLHPGPPIHRGGVERGERGDAAGGGVRRDRCRHGLVREPQPRRPGLVAGGPDPDPLGGGPDGLQRGDDGRPAL
jgi:hypothetical protein